MSEEGSAGLLHRITKERNTDLGERVGRCEIVGKLRSKKKNNGQNIGNAMRRYRICKSSHGGMRN